MTVFPTKLKLWETVRLSFVLQQLRNNRFTWLCVTSNFREWYFRFNHSFQFYETDFMHLVSSVYDSPHVDVLLVTAKWKPRKLDCNNCFVLKDCFILPRPRKWSFLQSVSDRSSTWLSHLRHAHYMYHPSHPQFIRLNNVMQTDKQTHESNNGTKNNLCYITGCISTTITWMQYQKPGSILSPRCRPLYNCTPLDANLRNSFRPWMKL
jgi:hypothetical protein